MIGYKIKSIRELKNLTQEYMAEKLDISQAAYSKLEKGNTKISEDKLNKIAEILEVNPEDITDFDNKKVLNSFNSIIGAHSTHKGNFLERANKKGKPKLPLG